METISQSNVSSLGTPSFSSWQKVDSPDAHVVRWMPDFSAPRCHGCHSKFFQWPISRKHHCRSKQQLNRTLTHHPSSLFSFSECGHVFCYSCTSYSKMIPQLDATEPVRVCRDCFSTLR